MKNDKVGGDLHIFCVAVSLTDKKERRKNEKVDLLFVCMYFLL